MKALLSALVATIAVPSLALAQTTDPQPDPPPIEDTAPPDPEPDYQPDPEPEPPPPPPREPDPEPEPTGDHSPKMSSHGNGDDGVNRPGGFSIGFGFGYDMPADLQIPDTTSVRFRLPNGLIIEPALEASRTSENMEVGAADVTDNTTVIAVSGAARFPVLSSSSMDLVGVGGAALANTTIDPEGGNNDTTITAVSLFYGIGVDLWIKKKWALSFTTLNPVILYSRSKTDDPTGGGDTTDTTTSVGLIFDPDVLVMLHLFFD